MEISPAEREFLSSSLRRMDLIEKNVEPVFIPLTGGVSSLIVRTETTKGPACLKAALPKLRVSAEWLAPVERNTAEVAWILEAARTVPLAVPNIIGIDEVGKAFAMSYLDPARHPNWKLQLSNGEVDLDTARSVGAVIGAIHGATATRSDLATRFANDDSFFRLRLEPYLVAAAKANPDCATAIDRVRELTASTKLALVHGDVSPKNILIGPQGPILLDAECAWYGDPAFDLAFALNHLLLKCAWHPEHTERYVDAFRALAAAYMAEVNWEPRTEIEHRACRLLPTLLLARVDGKSPVEYLTEPCRVLVRASAKHWIQHPPETLEDIATSWKANWSKQ